MASSIRVIIADDHPIVRNGIASALHASGDIVVVGEAADGAEALALVHQEVPDVLLLDIEMPEVSGVEVAERLQEHPVRILALSSYDDPEYAAGLLDSGASGYLTKEHAPLLILEAVRAVHRGDVRWFVQPERDVSKLDALTDREQDVLRRLAQGLSNAEIGDALNVSVHTIRSHVANIYAKLDVDSGREAIAWAWQNGVMDATRT